MKNDRRKAWKTASCAKNPPQNTKKGEQTSVHLVQCATTAIKVRL